jgi:carbamoyl-phosphate synthase small subunit
MNFVEAILLLENGDILHGRGIGVPGLICGEIVFNTGMVGYQEILTDPSYKGQIINFTCPHIGNTGITDEDYESDKVWATGIIVKELSSYFSNWQAKDSLKNFLYKQKIVGIQQIDTRYVTKKIRDSGNLNAAIMSGDNIDKSIALDALQEFSVVKLSYLLENTGVKTIKKLNSNFPRNIAVMDFGIKRSILDLLLEFNYNIVLFPSNSSFEEIMTFDPQLVFLSNGPGDPDSCICELETVKKIINARLPICGICLGFQLLALALGAETKKMSFGHHGINHPIQDLETKRVFITSQNHGFMVNKESLPNTIKITHCSLFDGTIQGFVHQYLSIFALQGHPEAGPGPSDTRILLKNFINSIDSR